MFDDLLKFSKIRTGAQAVGFYIAFLVLIVLLATLAGMVLAMVQPASDTFEAGVVTGTVVAIVCCLILSIAIVVKKNLSSFGYLLLVPVAGLLAGIGGGILGLIPVAYLTTRAGKGKK